VPKSRPSPLVTVGERLHGRRAASRSAFPVLRDPQPLIAATNPEPSEREAVPLPAPLVAQRLHGSRTASRSAFPVHRDPPTPDCRDEPLAIGTGSRSATCPPEGIVGLRHGLGRNVAGPIGLQADASRLYEKLAGWPVDSSTACQSSLVGSTLRRPWMTTPNGRFTKCPCQRPTSIPVFPATAAWTAAWARREQ
jgi:hypothetical protein